MATNNYIILSYLSLNIKVICNRTEPISWLREFFYPQFEITDVNPSDCEIAFIEDDKSFNDLHQNPPRTRAETNGFNLDNKTIKLILWCMDERWQVLFDEELNVFYRISYKKDQVRILYSSTSGSSSRMALMRVIREYAMNYDHPEAGYYIHSSALDYQGNAIMIAGPKNSGKTSLLIYFLLHLSSKFISNDRAFLYFDAFKPVVQGMPTVVTIPQNTLKMFSKVGVSLPIYKYHHWYTLAESINQPPFLKKPDEGEYTITPRQFCELIGTESCCKTSLSAIIFPRVSKAYGGIYFEKIEGDKTIDRLKEARFAKNIINNKSVFHLASKKPKAIDPSCSYDEFITKCASALSCFDCIIGYNAYEKNNAEDLISQVIGRETRSF